MNRLSFQVLEGPEDQGYVDQLSRCLDAGIPVLPLNHRLPAETRKAQVAFLHELPLFEHAATALFTSGSSDRPKVVVHDVDAHRFSARGANLNMPLKPDHRWLVSLPLYHVGGLAILFRCREAGATPVLREQGVAFGEQIVRDRITHLSLVPTQLQRLLDAGIDLSALQAILLGGAVIPARLVERALACGLPIHTSYGMTETASQVTTTEAGASLETLRTAGRLLQHRELRIDADGQILVRGPVRMLGYAGGPRWPPEDWFPTGDLGHLDDQGRLVVTGRRDNQFISGGENIHPEIIERALLHCDGVSQAVVVPRPDAEFGFRPVAFVEASVFDPGAWSELLKVTLPGFMIPEAYHRWPQEFPEGLKASRAWFRKHI